MKKTKRGRGRPRKDAAALPKRPPKKTGKRGPYPETDSAAPQNETPAPGQESAGEAIDTSEGSLIAEQPPRPVVVGDRCEAYFLKPTFSRMTKGDRLVALHMTFPLTQEHTEDGILPKRIRDDWALMNKHGRTKLYLNGIKGQRVCFFLSSDAPEDDPKLLLPAAKVTDVQLAVVQKKGEGEAKKVIRLSFRLVVPVSHDVAKFAEMNYGNNFWIKMEETDEPLFDEEE